MMPRKRNKLITILFAVYMLLLTGIILFKLPFYSPQISDGIRVISLIPFQGSFDNNGTIVWSEIRNNILIFIPFGIYLCVLRGEWTFRKKALAVVLLSFMFETVQFIFALGRSDITDILDNTLGGIIGIGMYALLLKILRDKTSKAVIILALTVTICVVFRFAWLFYLSHFVMRTLHP